MPRPVVGDQDVFEGIYTEKFRGLARPFGEFVVYERDRAAIDLGLHLSEKTDHRFRTVSNTRVWFQLKGVRSSTLGRKDFEACKDVALDIALDDIRFWYASPEAVYLGVYIECADVFLVEDVRDIVDRQWGEKVFLPSTFRDGQRSARLRILTSARLDDSAWTRMLAHRSLRIDGPTFRGRPLGHRLDPMRCVPKKMDPPVFADVVNGLLSAHRYRVTEYLDTRMLFPEAATHGDILSLSTGTMCNTYEWVLQLTSEFGQDQGSDFRIEGAVHHVQGPCAILVHSRKESYPEPSAVLALATNLVTNRKIQRLLVFANVDCYEDPGYFGSFFGGVRGSGLRCVPQLLGDLAFNLLTATTVYLNFRDKISWSFVNYLYQGDHALPCKAERQLRPHPEGG